MARFGEISPPGQHFMNICQMVEGLFSVWQTFKPTLAKLLSFGAALHYCTWPNIKK